MPAILSVPGFRFFFFSGEGMEPPYVHVEHDDKVAKFWLTGGKSPLRSSGFLACAMLQQLSAETGDRSARASEFIGRRLSKTLWAVR